MRIGTRGSALALAQAGLVRDALARATGTVAELVTISTAGDRLAGDLPVSSKGLFVTEIQQALLGGAIDLAVHSAKDLPARAPDGIALGAVPAREDPRDALVSAGPTLEELPPGARVGTSSLRRSAQLRALARGLEPTPIRGNVDTRLRKLDAGEVDALVLAVAGLARLGLRARATQVVPSHVMLPSPGQGALAVECRADDEGVRVVLAGVEDPEARAAVEAERAFMVALDGDCRLPLGALASVRDGRVRLEGAVSSVDGARVIKGELAGTDPREVGLALAERLRNEGADELIAAART